MKTNHGLTSDAESRTISGIETRPMKLIAHRGFANEYPENTLSAFQRAASQADMIEFDLRRCGSGELVVIHDGIVDAVTDSRGRVGDLTASELRQLNVLNSGGGVPTFEDVFKELPDDVEVNLHVKEPDLLPDVARAIAGAEDRVVISSTNREVLEAAKKDGRWLRTALIFVSSPEANLERARNLECDYIQPHWGVCIATRLVDRAHALGIGVFVWSINSNLGASVLHLHGVDGVIADRPVRGTQLRAEDSSPWWFPRWFRRSELRVRLAYQILRILAFVAVILVVGQLVKTYGWTRSRLNVLDRWSNRPILSRSTTLLAISLLLIGWKLRAVGTDNVGRWRGEPQLLSGMQRLQTRMSRFVSNTRVLRSTVTVRSVQLLVTLSMLLSYLTLVASWKLSSILWNIIRKLIRKSLSTTITRI